MTPPHVSGTLPSPRLAFLLGPCPTSADSVALREIRNLREQGFEIQVASIDPPDRPLDDLPSAEREEAEAVFCVKNQSLRATLSAISWALREHPLGFLRSLLFVWKLSRLDLERWVRHHGCWLHALMIGRWMEQQALRHVHVDSATYSGTAAMIAREVLPVDYSLTVHGPDEFCDAAGYCLREKLLRAKFVLCTSQYARSQLMKLTPSSQWDKFHVCRPGVDPEILQPIERRPDNESFTIVSVGRLVGAKGPMVLLRAVKRLHDAGRQIRLFLIGGGPLESELKNWVIAQGLGGVITLTGPIDPSRVRDYYACADCLALASFAEGMPEVLMEAMAMAVPCVATRIAGIPELIHDERDGLLVAAGDEVGLAAAIGLLMDDTVLRRKLGQAGRGRITAEYHFERNLRLLAEKFRTLLPGLRPS